MEVHSFVRAYLVEGGRFVIISITVLTVIGLALLVPNYLAVRFALLEGASAGPAAARSRAVTTRVSGHRGSGSLWARVTQRAYSWKALSPLVFAVSVIMGIALGGIIGIAVVVLALLNLLWGATGWGAYIPGKR